jgi:type I restriction enzyme S subunit
LPELPAGWAYSYLADMGDLGRGKSKHRPRNDPRLFGGSFPFIQTGEVKAANRVIRSHSQTYSDFGLAQSKLWPKGTLCITIAANIAETAFLGFEGCFPDSVVGFTAFEPVVRAEYIDYFIQAARTRIEAYAPATAQKYQPRNLGELGCSVLLKRGAGSGVM